MYRAISAKKTVHKRHGSIVALQNHVHLCSITILRCLPAAYRELLSWHSDPFQPLPRTTASVIADQDRQWAVASDAAQQRSCNACQSAHQTGNSTAYGACCCLYLQAKDVHATVAVPATIILATTRHRQAIPTTVAFCCGITFVRELLMRQAPGAIMHGTDARA
jgi:hypothetical protein